MINDIVIINCEQIIIDNLLSRYEIRWTLVRNETELHLIW